MGSRFAIAKILPLWQAENHRKMTIFRWGFYRRPFDSGEWDHSYRYMYLGMHNLWALSNTWRKRKRIDYQVPSNSTILLLLYFMLNSLVFSYVYLFFIFWVFLWKFRLHHHSNYPPSKRSSLSENEENYFSSLTIMSRWLFNY